MREVEHNVKLTYRRSEEQSAIEMAGLLLLITNMLLVDYYSTGGEFASQHVAFVPVLLVGAFVAVALRGLGQKLVLDSRQLVSPGGIYRLPWWMVRSMTVEHDRAGRVARIALETGRWWPVTIRGFENQDEIAAIIDTRVPRDVRRRTRRRAMWSMPPALRVLLLALAPWIGHGIALLAFSGLRP